MILKEFAKYTYSLDEVLKDTQIIKYKDVDTYVGRKDHPGIYDKRPV